MIEIVDALDEDGLLRYYGSSYGTALGSYVAAMFPERVERMVLDANLNPHDYQVGHYGEFTADIDDTFAGFLNACFNVTEDCALYTQIRPNSTQDLLDAINSALTPLARSSTSGVEAYLTYLTTKSSFVSPLYFPRGWPTFAENLAALPNGSSPTSGAGPPVEAYGEANQALIGIRASDATFIANSSDDYLPQVQFQSTVSSGFSDTSYFTLWPSAQWRMPAKERYWGDFNVQTKTPILYINGQFDPVTPLVNAYNARAAFEGSKVLPHNGYGHGIFAYPSNCVAQYIQAYFRNGTLLPEDTSCEPDMTLAQLWTSTAQGTGSENGSSSGNGTTTDNESKATHTRGSSGSLLVALLVVLASQML